MTYTIYTAATIYKGEWHAVDAAMPANADTPAKQMAYIADTASNCGRDVFRVFSVTFDGFGAAQAEDVTSEAICCLVALLRAKDATLRLDCALGFLPFWWQQHDPSLTPQEMDLNASDPDAEDWSPVTLQRELGTM